MAVVLRFTATNLSAARYEQITTKLEEAGAGSPAGRLYHVCFGDTDNLRVSDIWDSQESFERFSETLKPIMQDVGISDPNIEFLEVHNIIVGETATGATP